MRRRTKLAVSIAALLLGAAAVYVARNRAGVSPSTSGAGDRKAGGFVHADEVRGWTQDRDAARASIAGLIRDADGKPVDGAEVVALPSPSDGAAFDITLFERKPSATATSGAGGRYELRELPPGRFTLAATARGHAGGVRARVTVAPGAQLTGVDITLARGGLPLTGRVVDSGGGPVAGARVLAMSIERGDALGGAFPARTDAEGKYEMKLVRGGYVLRAEADGYAPDTSFVMMSAPHTRVFRLNPAARIAGKVVEADGETPVADAQVRVFSAEAFSSGQREGRTDDSGAFAFNDLEPGTYRLHARRGPMVGQAAGPVAVALGKRVEVVVRVARGRSIRGRVMSAAGKPIAGASVTSESEARGVFADLPTATTSDDQGAFTLEGLRPGRLSVEARAAGHARERTSVAVGASDVQGIELRLRPEAVIDGRVITAAGAPVADAVVFAWVRTQSQRTDGWEPVRTDAEGKFRVDRLGPGRLELRVQHHDGVASHGPEELPAGTSRTIVLKLQPGAYASGLVRTSDGHPVPHAMVNGFVRRAFVPIPPARADETGRYTLGPLPVGTTMLQAVAPDEGAMWVPPPAGVEDANVTLAAGERKENVDLVAWSTNARISGTVLDHKGNPVEGALISAGPEWHGQAWQTTYRNFLSGLDGRFSIENVAKNSYTVWAAHPEYPTGERKGVASGTNDLTIQLPAASSIAGVAVTSDGKPIVDFSVVLTTAASPNEGIEAREARMAGVGVQRQDVHDASGAFSFARLNPGRYELVVTTGDQRSGRAGPIPIAEGERRGGLRVTVGSGATLRGRVIDLDTHQPIASAIVQSGGVGMDLRATAGADGHFELPGVPTGRDVALQVAGDRASYVVEEMEVTIPQEGGPLDLGDIRLQPGVIEYGRPGSGLTGVKPVRRNGQVIAGNLRAGHPAEKAGIKQGDLILELDGKDMRNAPAGTVNQRLFGDAGAPLTLVVQTPGSAPRTVTFNRAQRN